MNNLQFRFWDKENKKMLSEQQEVDTNTEGVYLRPYWGLFVIHFEEWWHSEFDVTEEYIIMQSSWLKDKSWISIYDGDVLRIESWRTIWVGFWNKETACFEIKQVGDELNRFRLNNAISPEVIWNVHENPELLTKSTWRNASINGFGIILRG